MSSEGTSVAALLWAPITAAVSALSVSRQLRLRQNVTGVLPTIIWPATARQWKPFQSMLPPLA